jgi:hypothetical protein
MIDGQRRSRNKKHMLLPDPPGKIVIDILMRFAH